jgi:DNA-binding SARP family transcriptional activator
MTLQFGVLGPLVVWTEGGAIEVKGAKGRCLLAYLLVHAGDPQPLERIVDALWSGSPSGGAESTVQRYVSRLRKELSSHGLDLVRGAGGYLLEFDANGLDSNRFEAAVSAASVTDDLEQRLLLVNDALGLWRGPPLDEFAGQAWADERARQWTRMHMFAHQLYAAARLDLGRHRDVLPTLERLVSAYPLHEPFWAQLIVARYRAGQQADALAALSEAREVLATELGIEPGPELTKLERRILEQHESLDPPVQHAASSPNTRSASVSEPLPDGVVTFLLTDIEGSTGLWDQDPQHMAPALLRHEAVIGDVVHAHDGRLLKSRGEGDATLSAFLKATDAAEAAVEIQRRLQHEPWPGGLDLPTRIALHTGEAELRDGDYYGGTLNRAARIRGLAAGGQVLVSHATHDLVADILPADTQLINLGIRELQGLRRDETVYALHAPGLPDVEQPPAPQRRERNAFVGRADALERLSAAIGHPGLVTITGPGGIGKTRLAAEVVDRVDASFRRRYYVPLVAVRDAAGVEAAIRSVLALDRRGMQQPVGDDVDLAEGVASIAGPLLVVLDNCEQSTKRSPTSSTGFLCDARGCRYLRRAASRSASPANGSPPSIGLPYRRPARR